MFDSLKNLIERRLGQLIVIDYLSHGSNYFIKVAPAHLLAAAFFLKNDPDTRLTLLDQIIIIPSGVLAWKIQATKAHEPFEILYQLKSLKLPYRVSLVVEAPLRGEILPTISTLFVGAHWLEADMRHSHGIEFEDRERLTL